MRAQTQPINPPQGCSTLRVNYVDTNKYRDFKAKLQKRTDDLGAYVTNSMEADLQTAAKNADPQVMYQSLVKFVRLEKSGSGYLYAQHIQVFDEKGNSIAIAGTATSSSVYSVDYGAKNALSGQGYFYTQYDSNGATGKWWQVELQKPSRVSKIVVSYVPSDNVKLVLQNGDKTLVKEFSVAQPNQEFTVALTQTTNDVIGQKMNHLKGLETDVQSVLKCLQEEIVQRENISSDIYDLQQKAKEKKEQVETKDINVRSSKERAALLRDPYSETTVWESWFPLGRPLEKSSVPVLWTMALIFLIVSLGLFLYMVGFQLEIEFIKKASEGVSSIFNKPRNAPVMPSAPPMPPLQPAVK
jgi:hypothetical protein